MNQDTEAVVIFAIGAAILVALVGIFGSKDRPKMDRHGERPSTPKPTAADPALDDWSDWPDDEARAIAERAIHRPDDHANANARADRAIAETIAKHRIATGMSAAGRARRGRA